MGARFYDPEIGRFISQDPAKDGLNWYTYCDNNPINRVDPDGQWSVSISIGGSASFGGGVQGGMSIAVDSSGNFALLGYLGPRLETNIQASGGVTVSVSPTMPDVTKWSGWGWSTGVSGGELFTVGAGIGASSGYEFYSFAPGVGASVIPGDISIEWSYSWLFKSWEAESYSGNGVTIKVDPETGTASIVVLGQEYDIDEDGQCTIRSTPDEQN
ncbi:MAG: RHS repeat-associated core domain-containing protein [Firmicutes bacterium]|nr:RHS repeat-associated core domain-containing protein [Bacillota bacterium]